MTVNLRPFLTRIATSPPRTDPTPLLPLALRETTAVWYPGTERALPANCASWIAATSTFVSDSQRLSSPIFPRIPSAFQLRPAVGFERCSCGGISGSWLCGCSLPGAPMGHRLACPRRRASRRGALESLTYAGRAAPCEQRARAREGTEVCRWRQCGSSQQLRDGGAAGRRRRGVPHVGSFRIPFGDARVVFEPLAPEVGWSAVPRRGSPPPPPPPSSTAGRRDPLDDSSTGVVPPPRAVKGCEMACAGEG